MNVEISQLLSSSRCLVMVIVSRVKPYLSADLRYYRLQVHRLSTTQCIYACNLVHAKPSSSRQLVGFVCLQLCILYVYYFNVRDLFKDKDLKILTVLYKTRHIIIHTNCLLTTGTGWTRGLVSQEGPIFNR